MISLHGPGALNPNGVNDEIDDLEEKDEEEKHEPHRRIAPRQKKL